MVSRAEDGQVCLNRLTDCSSTILGKKKAKAFERSVVAEMAEAPSPSSCSFGTRNHI